MNSIDTTPVSADVDAIRARVEKVLGRMRRHVQWAADHNGNGGTISLQHEDSQALLDLVDRTCQWKHMDVTEGDTGNYEGSCGVAWTMIDGTLADNEMEFCPRCGGKIIPPITLCEAWHEETGESCIHAEGHEGPHQSRVCDGTCDHCECVEWSNTAQAGAGGA